MQSVQYNGYLFGAVDTDRMVLKQQGISSHSAEYGFIYRMNSRPVELAHQTQISHRGYYTWVHYTWGT